jgi:hypothetical protein
VPPRFGSTSFANDQLRGPMPSEELLAVPNDPVDDLNTNFSFADYMEDKKIVDAPANPGTPLEYIDPSEVLPGDDMSSIKYGKLASDPDTYMYDRLIFANKRRRNWEGSDKIRGDLPIAPVGHDKEGAWFQVSAKPHLDLYKGAMRYIGPDYETSLQMEDLIVNSKAEDRDSHITRFA